MNGPVWATSLRSRPLANLLLFALSAVAVLTSALGPLLVRAIEQSTIADTLQAAGPSRTSLTVFVNGHVGEDVRPLAGTVSAVLGTPLIHEPTAALWEPPQTWIESVANVSWSSRAQRTPGRTVSRVRVAEPDCAGLPVVDGRCPKATNEVLVSTTDARRGRLAAGSRLVYGVLSVLDAPLTVVGTYDPDRVPTPLTRPGTELGVTAAVTGDPLVMTRSQVARLPLSTQVWGRLLLRGRVTVADEPLLRGSATDLNSVALEQSVIVAVQTDLPAVLDQVDAQTRSARVLIGVTEAQALGLAMFALGVVLQRVGRARSAEWGIGRLRGVPRRRWLGSVYLEPAVALLLGLPAGLAGALLVAQRSVAANLRPGIPVELLRWPVLLAAGAASLASLLALVAVSAPSVAKPLAELIQERSESRRLTPLGAVAQSMVVLLAGVTLYELLAGGVLSARGPQLGLLAPGMFALALAVLAVRLAVAVVRRVTRRPPRSLVGLVVGRQAARTPSVLNPAIVIAVGVALAVFASQVLALSVRNQGLRAAAITGADTVLTVSKPPGTDLLTEVRAADPGGRFAMAVQEKAASAYTGTGRVLAVDTERLAAVAAWSPAWAGAGDLATALHPATAAPITLRGRSVEVRLADVYVRPSAVPASNRAPAHPDLLLVLDTGPSWRTVRLGPVDSGSRLTTSIPCAAGCRVVSLGLASGPVQPYRATFTITGIGTDRQPAAASTAWLRDGARWHSRVGDRIAPDPDAQATPTASTAGLTLKVSDVQGGTAALVSSSDVDDPLPAVLGPQTTEQPYSGIKDAALGTGLDGNGQLISVVGRASVLPRALGDGALVDLRNAIGLSDPAKNTATNEVWLAPGAPASIGQALAAAGLQVQSRERLADARDTLLRQPTTRAAAVAVSLGYAAVLLAVLALVAARVADARRRRADWRSLGDAGLSAGTVRRLIAVEVALPALLGTALGLASGLAALALAAPRLPLVDVSTIGPPLDLGVSWTPVVALGVGSAVVIAAIATVGAAIEAPPQLEARP